MKTADETDPWHSSSAFVRDPDNLGRIDPFIISQMALAFALLAGQNLSRTVH